MTLPTNHAGLGRPVERFRASSGFAMGYVGLALVAFGIGYVALNAQTLTGLRVALGLAFFGVVVWVTQLRSQAAAYADTLVLRNSLVDTAIPLHRVDEVSAARTLNVWVGDKRYVCIGIGRNLRSAARSPARGQGGEEPPRSERPLTDLAYEDFVAARIDDLAGQARRAQPPGEEVAPVRFRPAWVPIAALVATGLAFLASLLV